MFADRRDAGVKLAGRLKKENIRIDLVFALPRGGVVVGEEVARALGVQLDIVVPRKIGAQGNPEYAIGAITETGGAVWNESERRSADSEWLKKEIAKEKQEAERRLKTYRGARGPLGISGKHVLIVDDGVATGLTMRAAILSVRERDAAYIAVAVPCGPQDTIQELRMESDRVIVLEIPEFFSAVGGCYSDFPQTTDEEVIAIMSRYANHHD